jgi:CHAT domain-containing protein
MTRWDSDVEGKILEILAKARALRNFVRDRLLASAGDSEVSDRQRTLATNYSDLGILDSIAAGIAGMYGAVELQEKYLRRFVETGKLLADVAPARLASRRGRLLEFLLAAGKEDEAAEIIAELEASLATNTDVAMSFVVNTALGVLSVNRGEWTEQTLDRLEQACVAHSEIRRGAIDVGEIGRFGVFALPPFQEAIEVAITLGHPERAFDLLQSAKSRTLLDALRDKPPAVDGENPLLVEEETLWQQFVRLRASSLTNSGQELTAHQRAGALFQAGEEIDELRRRLEEVWNSLADSHPEIRTHRMASPATVSDVLALLSRRGDATLVEFFVGRKGIYTFTVAAGRIAVNRVVDENDPSLDEFFDLVRDDDPHNVTRLLGQPVYQKLVRIVGSTSGRTYLAPYGPLHLVPLHLLSHDDGTLAPRPGTFLVPSASLLRATHSGSLLKRETLVIGGDPLGDLPFARSESTGIAARLGGEARHGGDVTFDWLVGALDGSARLVHLACHAAFDDVRPERSSLLLADSEGNPDRITLPRLASLNWSGALVVLSACQSGKHHVRTGDELTGIASTLLAAGATALVTSFRPVPDRATAVLMLWFYERLAQHGDWSLESVSDALTTAQRRLAEASAHDILSWVRRSVEANDMDPTLAYGMLAAAHRAAGETDRYLSCQQRLRQLSANELTESLDDLLRSATPPPRSDYTARPFKHAANWAMFSIITGG